MEALSLGFVGGLIAWFFSNFVGEPLLSLLSVRRKTAEGILFYANSIRPKQFDEAEKYFRQLAACLEGLRNGYFNSLFRLLGFNLSAASAGLIGYSNTFRSSDGERVRYRVQAQKALRIFLDPGDVVFLSLQHSAKS